MNPFAMLQSDILKALGMSMIHSIWEGVLVLLPVLLLLALIDKKKAGLRYLVLYAGLMSMVFLFVLTFLHIYQATMNGETAGNAGMSGRLTDLQSRGSPSFLNGSGTTGAGWYAQSMALLNATAPLLALIWIAGFMVTGLRLANSLYASQVFVRKQTYEPDHIVVTAFDKVRRLLKMDNPVRLKISANKISPMVTGIIRPVVVIPLAALANLSPSQVEAILAHELAHIKRYDHLLLLLQEVAKGILFFHPLAWYFSNGINREREHVCDDLVMKTYTDPIDYIKALTMVQEMNLAGINTANAVLGKPGRLLNRVRRLLRPQIQTAPLPRLIAVFALLLSAGLLLATTFRVAENPAVIRGTSSPLSVMESPANQPEDSNRVEVVVSIDTYETRQDTNIIMVTKRVRTTGASDATETEEMRVRMLNDSIREITINGKPVPPGDYALYADTVKYLRTALIVTDGTRSTIVVTDSANRDPRRVQQEIEVFINGVPSTEPDRKIDSLIKGNNHNKEIEIIIREGESSTLNRIWMDDLMANLYATGEPFTQFTERFETFQEDSSLYKYFDQLRKVQEEARLSAEEIRKLQQETARRAADQARQYFDQAGEQAAEQARVQAERAREQAEQARVQAERARQFSDQAREQMERSRVAQEAARQQMQEEMKRILEEKRQKQQEMQELLKNSAPANLNDMNSTLKDLEK